MNETPSPSDVMASPLYNLLKDKLVENRRFAKTYGYEWDVADALSAVIGGLEEAQRDGYVVI